MPKSLLVITTCSVASGTRQRMVVGLGMGSGAVFVQFMQYGLGGKIVPFSSFLGTVFVIPEVSRLCPTVVVIDILSFRQSRESWWSAAGVNRVAVLQTVMVHSYLVLFKATNFKNKKVSHSEFTLFLGHEIAYSGLRDLL